MGITAETDARAAEKTVASREEEVRRASRTVRDRAREEVRLRHRSLLIPKEKAKAESRKANTINSAVINSTD